MGKPSDIELKQALEKAAEMREHDQDPDFIAKSLLSLNYRFDVWQRVIETIQSTNSNFSPLNVLTEFPRSSSQCCCQRTFSCCVICSAFSVSSF